MSPTRCAAARDLFSDADAMANGVEKLAEGAVLLRGYAADVAPELVNALCDVIAASPMRHMVVPGGRRMSVAMTNCGRAGWISDRSGYRYAAVDPATSQPWPSMPSSFMELATRAAGFAGFSGFEPDSCLINRYEPGARLSLHQDRDERDFGAPIVSTSLGLPAIFLFGGLQHSDRRQRVRLESGDVAVWGGTARLAFHGVAPLADGVHPLTGRCRLNLTFRKAL